MKQQKEKEYIMPGTKYDCTVKKESKERQYKGHTIWRATTNSAGIKYYAYTNNGTLRADTLQGIKNLIKKYHATNNT